MKGLMNSEINENVYNFGIWTCHLYHSSLRSKIYWFWENRFLLKFSFLLILFYVEYIQTFAIYILIEYYSNSSWFSLVNHTLLKIRHFIAFRHQANMPSNHRIQFGCIFKRKVNASIHIVITSVFSHRNLIDSSIFFTNDSNSLRIPSSIGEISRINIAFLNILIIHLENYEIDLDAIKTIIHDNQIEVYQVNLDIFNQLMK